MAWLGNYWIYIAAFLVIAAFALNFGSAPRAVRLILRDLDLDTTGGQWKGREVDLAIETQEKRFPRRAVVRIAASGPTRLRLRSNSVGTPYLSGPPKIDCADAPQDVAVWSDDEAFARQLLTNDTLRTRVSMTISIYGDAIELNAESIRVEVATSRFESEYSALWAAWRAATEIIDGMSLAVPNDGKLPLVDSHDAVVAGGP